jgi:hypothetical protein
MKLDIHSLVMRGDVKIAVLLILLVFVVACNDLSPEEVEKRIAGSERLKVLDHFCGDLPKPEGFNFAYKKISGNSQEVTISYRYRTESSFSNVRDFYMNYFAREGWTREIFWNEDENFHQGQVEYRNGKRTVWIEHVAFPNANYSVSCTQED